MNSLQVNARTVIETAREAEQQGRLAESLAGYTDGHRMLQAIMSLEATSMSEDARGRLQTYMTQIGNKILSLQSRVPSASLRPSVAAADEKKPVAPKPTPTAVPAASGSTARIHEDIPCVLPSLPPPPSVPPKQAAPTTGSKPTVAPSSAAASNKKNVIHTDPESGGDPKSTPTTSSAAPSAEPPRPSLIPSSDKTLAPRTSAVVMRAIELSTRLSKERKYKQAIDVMQHAFDVGRVEGNNPSNFCKIESLILELRRKYYDVFKPRWFQDNPIAKEELDLLRKSGQTSMILLPIWDDVSDGYAAENVHIPCKEERWVDKFTPSLSPKQKASNAAMEHYPLVVSNPSALRVFKGADPMNIKQTVVGDCSLVCSLIVCSNFEKRFPKANLISSVIYPQDEDGVPVVNQKGKYCVKMMVNGITRMVVVDDRIPVSTTGRCPPGPTTPTQPATPTAMSFLKQPLCTYSKDPGEMWVSLIEKAFVKLCGGSYDFPGSTSSVDMFKLSGWLPDSVTFDAEGFDVDLQWKRLHHSHSRGAALITVSTPQNQAPEVEARLKLVPGHAYAVLHMVEEDGKRLLKIKNPWASQSWEGLCSLNDKNWPPELLTKLAFTAEEADQGVFWMTWYDVVKFFKRANVSWNPYLLYSPDGVTLRKPNRLACHGILKASSCYGQCPQYHVEVRNLKRVARMHVVLSRHVIDLSEYNKKEDENNDTTPLITAHVFDVTGSPSLAQMASGRQGDTNLPRCGLLCTARLVQHGAELQGGMERACLHRGIYRNVECQTISFNCPPGNRDLVLCVSQLIEGEQQSQRTSFPFTILLHTDISLASSPTSTSAAAEVSMHRIPAPVPLDEEGLSAALARRSTSAETAPQKAAPLVHVCSIKGAWVSGQSCGGRVDSQTFVFNPQYRLTLSAPTPVCVRLCAPSNKEAVQVHVVRRAISTQQSPSATRPWVDRVDRMSPATCSMVLQCPMYLQGGCILDTVLGEACVAYDMSNTVKAPPPPPPCAPPPPPMAAPPAMSLTVQVPKASTSFVITEVAPLTRVAPLIVTAALAQSLLATPLLSKCVHRGQTLDLSTQTATVNTIDLSTPIVLLLNTDDVQRTPKLQEILLELYSVAKSSMEILHRHWTQGPVGAAATGKDRAACEESITQLLTKLDASPCLTDAIREGRKALVLSCHAVHQLLDGMLQGQASSSPTGAPTASSPTTPATATVPPSIPLTPLNPLPAGNYTIIVSTWAKGSPSVFDLSVEALAPCTLTEIQPEGSGGWKSTILQSQFRSAPPPPSDWLMRSSSMATPHVRLPHDHPTFQQNPSFTLSSPKDNVLSLRLITIEANPQQLKSSTTTCLAVFSFMDGSSDGAARMMELGMVTPFSDNGTSIPEIILRAHKQYVVVAFSGTQCSLPFVLKCFSQSDVAARANH